MWWCCKAGRSKAGLTHCCSQLQALQPALTLTPPRASFGGGSIAPRCLLLVRLAEPCGTTAQSTWHALRSAAPLVAVHRG